MNKSKKSKPGSSNPVALDEIKTQAAALYAQGLDFPAIAKRIDQEQGFRVRIPATYRKWANANPELWQRPTRQKPAADAEDISVRAEIARYRNVRGRVNGLLDQQETLTSAEVNELKTLLRVEEDLQGKIDPDRLLDWLERFMRWVADTASDDDCARVVELCQRFAEAVFGVIDAAVVPGRRDQGDSCA